MSAELICAVDERRQLVRDKKWNGLDYIDVGEDQITLCVHFFAEVPKSLRAANVIIEGGRRIRDIRVVSITAEQDDDPEHEECLRVVVNKPGDFSPYKLRLVALDKDGRPTGKPPEGFDVRYSSVTFSFKVNCPSDLDCAPVPEDCCDERAPEPAVDYLAKDYSSFRRLILDRLALVMPDWTERHVPDVGIALVEILAYVGDYLSYYQDAVGTEAYLDTARRRISVRRHARLVDYLIHEGCNARAWLVFTTEVDRTKEGALDLEDTYFITRCEGMELLEGDIYQEHALERLPADRYQRFEPLLERPSETKLSLWAAHNEIRFYTWGDSECALPRGATRATLDDEWPSPPPDSPSPDSPPPDAKQPCPRPLANLRVGDVLLFEEVLGPETGTTADADPLHRWFVRLTKVTPSLDELTQRHVVEIEWSPADALPFDLCITTVLPAPECRRVGDLTVARGNVLLVDHGFRVKDEAVVVEAREIIGTCACEESLVDVELLPKRTRPALKKKNPTFWEPLPADVTARGASEVLKQDPQKALPMTHIEATAPPPPNCPPVESRWEPKRDLLGSGPYDRHFVLEVDNERVGRVRFGDGELGAHPSVGTSLEAVYRVGSPLAGNVEAETITRIVTRKTRLEAELQSPPSRKAELQSPPSRKAELQSPPSPKARLTVRNPLPAKGGTLPESLPHAKLSAPRAFRGELRRAITAEDYATIAEKDPRIQRAAASLAWTGSWYEAKVAIDPLGTTEVDPALLRSVEDRLERYRRLGHDVRAVPARYVPLDIGIRICVKPSFLRAHVKADVAARLLAFFHPDQLTFGAPICPSDVLAAAQSVTGVESVTLLWLRRLFDPIGSLDAKTGELTLRPDEVAQLDNDPNYPEHGKLTLTMGGGR